VWIASTLGFFSIVRDHSDQRVTHVRARRREHLEQLCGYAHTCGMIDLRKHLLATPERDYPWRIVMPTLYLHDLMSVLSSSVVYPNFKAEVQRTDPATAAVYSRVWAMLRLGIDEREAPLPFERRLLDPLGDLEPPLPHEQEPL